MKLKKLLAAVTAAALAVTTMAVTSFTVSAATEAITIPASGQVEITNLDKYSDFTFEFAPKSASECSHHETGHGGASTEYCTWSGIAVAASVETNGEINYWLDLGLKAETNEDAASCTATLTKEQIIAKVKEKSSNSSTLLKIYFQAQDCTFVSLTGTLDSSYVELKSDEWTKTGTGTYVIQGEAPGETPNYATGSSKPGDFIVPVDDLLPAGKTAADIESITAAVTISGGDANGQIASNVDGEWSSKAWSNEGDTTVIWDTADDFSNVIFQVNYLGFSVKVTAQFTVKCKSGSEEPGEVSVTVTPATATVKAGETAQLTAAVTGKDDAVVTWQSTNTEVATVNASGLVTGVAEGSCEIRALVDGEFLGTPTSFSVVTVTEEGGDTPPAPPATTETLWEGSMAIGWNGDPEEGPVNMLLLGSDKFANIAAGGSLKFTFTGTGEAPQLKFMDGDWTELVSVQSDPNYTQYGTIALSGTSFSFTISAADAATLKAKGFKAGGQDCTVTKVEYIPEQGGNTPTPPPVVDPTPDDPTPDDPTHTHTPATTLSSDATGHWYACSGCTDKVEFAAHTSDGGTVTTPATATTAGTKTYKCSVCGYVMNTETIPATGSAPEPWNPPVGVAAPVIPTSGVNNSTAPTINGKDGWEAVAAEITTASDGDKLVVDMNGATKVPSTVFKAIKGKDVDLVLNLNSSIKWTINGLSVTSTSAIDFDVTKNTKHIPNEVVDKAEGSHKKQISLDHNGSFGCNAVMSYDVGTQYNGLYANLFYYNRKAKELELIDCSPISGGKANFMFTHASDYLITISDEPLGDYEDVSSAAGITSDNSGANSIAFCSVLTVITLAFGFVIYRKRRHN